MNFVPVCLLQPVLATYTRVASVCVCVCVCVSGARVAHVRVPARNMNKQLWDSSLRVHNEAAQPIDFKNRKWKFPIMVKVRVANFWLTSLSPCDLMNINNNIAPKKKYLKLSRRPLPSPSQDRHPEVSGIYQITVQWLHTRVGS